MKRNGFTLIELLVVATIISLLSSIGFITYSQFVKRSRDEKRKADLNTIRAALEMYRSDNNTYPVSLNDLINSIQKYLEKIPTDPKNYLYIYKPLPIGCNGNTIVCTDYVLYSYLETGGSCSLTGVPYCDSSNTTLCNYCIGPYGEK